MTLAATADPPPGELDEITLRRAQRGEPDACAALVARYQVPVFALVGRVLGPRHVSRVPDVAQDTFLDVFRNLTRFAPLGPARLSTWILTIATRRSIDALRRPGGTNTDEGLADAFDPAPGPGERAALGQAIARAAAALAPEYRAAFVLRELHGFEYAEIGRALGIDLGTVKSRLARARAALRAALAEVHDGR